MAKMTKQYDMFKKHPSNRELDQINLKKLINSMKHRNLLSLRPILVNKDLQVIDGQHRLEAAKTLGLDIYYEENHDVKTQDILILNVNQKPWTVEAYLNYYLQNNHEDYVKLDAFIHKHNLTIKLAIGLMYNSTHGDAYKKFKDGLFKFPDPWRIAEIEIRIEQINKVREFIKVKTIGSKNYLDSVTFAISLIIFFNIASVDYDMFMKKLEYKLDLVRPCMSSPKYIEIFKHIYNWKNQVPID
jgi:hypothetical protein